VRATEERQMRSSRIACRLSYLRTSPAFLASALSSDKARFVLYSGLNPLCAPPSPTDGAINLHTVSWADVQAIVVLIRVPATKDVPRST
jgi:hypothetical protein